MMSVCLFVCLFVPVNRCEVISIIVFDRGTEYPEESPKEVVGIEKEYLPLTYI